MTLSWTKEQYLGDPRQAIHDYSKASMHIAWGGIDKQYEEDLNALTQIYPNLPEAMKIFHEKDPTERDEAFLNELVELLRQ